MYCVTDKLLIKLVIRFLSINIKEHLGEGGMITAGVPLIRYE